MNADIYDAAYNFDVMDAAYSGHIPAIIDKCVKELRKVFPNKYVSIDVTHCVHNQINHAPDKVRTTYSVYIEDNQQYSETSINSHLSLVKYVEYVITSVIADNKQEATTNE